MRSIATAVSDTSATVALLGDDSRRISQIVTVIDEIARKTNLLLALNAAIEAARPPASRAAGFVVVVIFEVRRLAESTAQATGEIFAGDDPGHPGPHPHRHRQYGERHRHRRARCSHHQSGRAKLKQRIIGMAEQVDRMIAQIAIAASQQAAAADQSSASLDAIHNLSHDNLVEMATTAAGIETLRTTAVALEQQVDSFTLQSQSPSGKQKGPRPQADPSHRIPDHPEDLEVHLDIQLNQHRLAVLHRRNF